MVTVLQLFHGGMSVAPEALLARHNSNRTIRPTLVEAAETECKDAYEEEHLQHRSCE